MMSFVALSTLLVAVSAAPTRRAPLCDLSSVSSLSVTSSDPSDQIRWDLFSSSGDSINAGTLAWFKESQPDAPSKFRALASSNGPSIFSFQRASDSAEVALTASGSGFAATGGAATEFIVACAATCDLTAGDRQLVADACTMEVTDGQGTGTGLCVNYIGGSVVPVTTATCDGSASQQITFFHND